MTMAETSNHPILKIDHCVWYRPVKLLTEMFAERGFKVRIVGGAVRDIILHKQPKDVDLCTSANPDEMLELLVETHTSHRKTGIQHGTVTIYKKGLSFEMTSLRQDEVNAAGEKVIAYGKSFKEDSERRDLTINAMSIDIEGRLYDYHSGQEHLADGVLRFVKSAETRITEDPLRMLRYFRFACCSDCMFHIDCGDEYKKVFRSKSKLLNKIPGERIWKEMEMILSSGRCAETLDVMEDCGLLSVISIPKNGVDLYTELIDTTVCVPDVTSDNKAGIILGLIFKERPVELQDLIERWRASNRVKENAYSARFISNDTTLSEMKKKLYDEKPDRFAEQKRAFLQTVLSDKKCILTEGEKEELEKFTRPIFNLTKDHIAADIPKFKGKIKDCIESMRSEWIKSDFKLEVSQMIEMLKKAESEKSA